MVFSGLQSSSGSHPAQMKGGRGLWERFSRFPGIPVEAAKPAEEKFA